nr:MAG TPA: hypothetical protein [Caudoviricetes sp.]
MIKIKHSGKISLKTSCQFYKIITFGYFCLTNVVSKTPADIKRKRQSDNIYNKNFIMKKNKNKC